MNNAYALIMAGGAGTRLWPLSRLSLPKPALRLVDENRTMFQISVDRLLPLLPPERILVVANAALSAILREQSPEIPTENFIIEPFGQDTAPAIGLGAVHVRQRDPGAVMAVLTADHFIEDTDAFRAALGAASERAMQGVVVTLGITPTYPATGFGYIKQGTPAGEINGVGLYTLERFVEKPDQMRAEAFLAEGGYSWNSGMFIWQVDRLMREFATHTPDLSRDLEHIAEAIGRPDYDDVLASVWPGIRKISVDFALMEHLREDVQIIPTEMGWTDIGNFETLYDILLMTQPQADDHQNVALGAAPLCLDSDGTLIMSRRLVATIGVEDLVIVDTDDVLLVCRRDRAQDVKKLVDQLKNEKQDRYL